MPQDEIGRLPSDLNSIVIAADGVCRHSGNPGAEASAGLFVGNNSSRSPCQVLKTISQATATGLNWLLILLECTQAKGIKKTHRNLTLVTRYQGGFIILGQGMDGVGVRRGGRITNDGETDEGGESRPFRDGK